MVVGIDANEWESQHYVYEMTLYTLYIIFFFSSLVLRSHMCEWCFFFFARSSSGNKIESEFWFNFVWFKFYPLFYVFAQTTRRDNKKEPSVTNLVFFRYIFTITGERLFSDIDIVYQTEYISNEIFPFQTKSQKMKGFVILLWMLWSSITKKRISHEMVERHDAFLSIIYWIMQEMSIACQMFIKKAL